MSKEDMYYALIHEALYQLNRDYEMYLMLLNDAYQLRLEMEDEDQ